MKVGKELLFSNLLDLNNYLNTENFQNKYSFTVFKICNYILSKLPDFFIYKKDKKIQLKFVEVKYKKIKN